MKRTKEINEKYERIWIMVGSILLSVVVTIVSAWKLSVDDMNVLIVETPLCRIGTPMEIAHSILFLASENSDFITGQILSPNGGFLI